MKADETVRYVVPHTLDKDSLAEGNVRLQMRVKSPVESPVWVEVRSKGNLVARKAEPYARPGEIITLTLTPKAYDEVQKAAELVVGVVKR